MPRNLGGSGSTSKVWKVKAKGKAKYRGPCCATLNTSLGSVDQSFSTKVPFICLLSSPMMMLFPASRRKVDRIGWTAKSGKARKVLCQFTQTRYSTDHTSR